MDLCTRLGIIPFHQRSFEWVLFWVTGHQKNRTVERKQMQITMGIKRTPKKKKSKAKESIKNATSH